MVELLLHWTMLHSKLYALQECATWVHQKDDVTASLLGNGLLQSISQQRESQRMHPVT